MPSRSSRAIKSAAATSFVFLNCPFDDQYKPIFEALVFTIHACGFTARCALEDGGSEAVRLQRIIKMIQTCQLGIHDLRNRRVPGDHEKPGLRWVVFWVVSGAPPFRGSIATAWSTKSLSR